VIQVVPAVAALLIGFAAVAAGNGLLHSLLGLRLGLAGLTPLAIGAVLSCYFFGFILATISGHRVVERAGHIRSFAAFAALCSVSALLYAVSDEVLVWALLRALTGYSAAGMFMVTESWLNARAGNETRGRVLSLYMVTVYAAVGGGQFFLKLADPAGFELFVLVSVLLTLSLVPIVLTRTAAPAIEGPTRVGFRRLLELSPLGLALCFGAGLVNSAFYSLAPVYVLGIGLAPERIADFVVLAVLSGLALQWPIGWLSDRIERRLVVLGTCLVMGLSGSALWLVGVNPEAALGLIVLYGSCAFTVYGQGLSQANDHAEASELVAVSSGLLLFYGIGAVIGPLAASGVMAAMGPGGLFAYIAAVTAALALLTLYRRSARAALPLADQAPYVATLSTTPLVGELDPRGEDYQIEFAFEEQLAANDLRPTPAQIGS
jgi:MFS family permease